MELSLPTFPIEMSKFLIDVILLTHEKARRFHSAILFLLE